MITMAIILNLFREGTRLGFMTLISRILKDHYGIYDFHLTAAELIRRTAELNRFVDIGKISSMKTAEGYVLNSIALNLHEKKGSKIVLTPIAKTILCLQQDLAKIELSKAEKVVLLGLLLRIDDEGFLPVISFLKENGPSTIRQMLSSDAWIKIFANEKIKKLRGAARMHRLIPRIEWCKDLDLLKKTSLCHITPTGEKLLDFVSKGMHNSFDLSPKLYFPDLTIRNIDGLYDNFLDSLVDAYKKLLLLMPSAYHVEIVAVKLLIEVLFALENIWISQDQINSLFLTALKRNMEVIRLTAPYTKEKAEGIIINDRLYSYMTLNEGKLQ